VTAPKPAPAASDRAGSSRRRRARVACLRALYRSEVVGDSLEETASDVLAPDSLPDDVGDYARRLAGAVSAHREEIDRILSGILENWDLKRLAVVDRSVLRIAVAELLYEPGVPTRVVLDEAIEIAKRYGSPESGRFVNGILDRVARTHRGEDSL
jgi:N utilization substance protein B